MDHVSPAGEVAAPASPREAVPSARRPAFLEFFCGGGMARAGLGLGWRCAFANDLDARKGEAYARNWGAEALVVADVGRLQAADIPDADLAWASFPCQDLSLAGAGAGLAGARSGAFWPFWRLMAELKGERRAPALVMLENVGGALTSHGGSDFRALADALAGAGYRFGALLIDAADFVPQSRPRLFILAVSDALPVPSELVGDEAPDWGASPALLAAQRSLGGLAAERWLWWRLPAPALRNLALDDLIEETARWAAPEATRRLVSLMSDVHLAKIEQARRDGRRMVGAVYRRTRPTADGGRTQRAEVRFDGVAGCLRTPAGGSSRQTIVAVEGETIRSRLLSPREAARLMGLPESYQLPERYNEAYHLLGDGVVAPVVRYLAEQLMEPLLHARDAAREPRRRA